MSKRRQTVTTPTREQPPREEGGKLIAQVHTLSGRLFARILKAHGVAELSPAQGRIVYELWKQEGLTQSELCARTKLEKSTLALMLDRLEAQGQVRRQAHPDDGRRRIIMLTPKNRAAHAAYTLASRTMLKQFYAGLTTTQVTQFEATLRQVLVNLEMALAAQP